jgi:branched-chain amino acid transport system ATP-binding protein
VAENVRLAAQAHLGGSLVPWRSIRAGDRATRIATECLDRVGLGHRASVPAAVLSHGEKRKLELAILLAGDPSVILLDEPMAGMSTADVPSLTEVIRRVHRGDRRTVLMVEHHMHVVLALADRVAVMHHGALLAFDTPQAVMGDSLVQQAYLGSPL